MEIYRTRTYEKRSKKLLSEAEAISAELEITQDPESWPIISGSGGVRKARAARGNSGKSGGVRILYYCVMNEAVYLLDIYEKNAQENITEASKKIFREIVKTLKEQHHGKKSH